MVQKRKRAEKTRTGAGGAKQDLLERARRRLRHARRRGQKERARAEHAAKWLSTVVNVAQEAVISIDAERRIVLFNPAAERMFGYTKQEVVGEKVNVLMDEPYATDHDQYVERYERTRKAHAVGRIRLVSARRKNGETFPMELSVAELPAGQAERYVALIRDMSERFRYQNDLRHRERLATLGATAATLAHEIGNPLNAISLNLTLLERRLKRSSELESDVAALLRTANGDIERLRRLLDSVRGFSRHLQLALRPTEIPELIEDVLRLQVIGSHILVKRSFESALPKIVADGEKLRQVFLNLIKNAVEAMPNGGVLTVEGRPADADLLVQVGDTGAGIAENVDVFEPFRTTKAEGTGLGLAIVKEIVRAHGGSVTYATRLGKGTTFSLTLPIDGPAKAS